MPYVYARRVRGRVRVIDIEDVYVENLTALAVAEAAWAIDRWDLRLEGIRLSPRCRGL